MIQVSVDSIPIGQPLPYALLTADGAVAIPKRDIVDSRAQLTRIFGWNQPIFILKVDQPIHEATFRSFNTAQALKDWADGKIGGIAMMRPEDYPDPPRWPEMQEQANALLRDCTPPLFLPRVTQLYDQLRHYSVKNPDGTLLALFYLSTNDTHLYSATHAMLVSVMCGICARDVLRWSTEDERSLGLAALTMNVSMTALQDALASQPQPPSADQRQQIDTHAQRSVDLLRMAGVTDKNWLDAVLHHHNVEPGPLDTRPINERMARLIHRADIFSARRAPRAMRPPSSAAIAMQASYFDENKQVDEAGAALIKAVGVHSPGSYVALASGEIAIVIKRGFNTAMPKVAVLINNQGVPLAAPIVRDTSQRDYRVTGSVPAREVKIRLNLPKMLALAAT